MRKSFWSEQESPSCVVIKTLDVNNVETVLFALSDEEEAIEICDKLNNAVEELLG